jgi:hypothetical protein
LIAAVFGGRVEIAFFGCSQSAGDPPTADGERWLAQVDHLIYGTPDLESTVDELERRLGVRAAEGGRHPGQGTRNALISLGEAVYLEIMAPDPEQPPPDRPRWLGLDRVETPRLVGWAAVAGDLDALVRGANRRGIRLGETLAGGRRRPDGSTVSWRVTDPHRVLGDGVVPFFIDWADSPHPARSAPGGATLVGLRAEHPDADEVSRLLAGLGLGLPLRRGPLAALIATLRTPAGEFELR